MKHRVAVTLADVVRLVCVTILATSVVSAQGVQPFEAGPRGGVHQFDSDSSGVRSTGPGVHEYGRRESPTVASYFGIMGAVSADHAGTYSSTTADVELAQLVRSAQGLAENATGMALIIRNGRIAMQVFPNTHVTHRLLPGDLVVFHRDAAPEQAGAVDGDSVRVAAGTKADGLSHRDTVEVAFLGIINQRPIVLSLERQFATIAHVVDALNQLPEVAKTIRVIRTDSREGLLEGGTQPQQLADGDVLVFDARTLNPVGLSQAQEFPAAIPMTIGQPTSLSHEADNHTAGIEIVPTPTPVPRPVGANVSIGPEHGMVEPLRAFEETPLPPLDFPSASHDDSIPFAPMIESAEGQTSHSMSVRQSSHDLESASHQAGPVPRIQEPELPAAKLTRRPAPVTPSPEMEPTPTTSAYFETSHVEPNVSQVHGEIPTPIEPQLTSLDDGDLSQIQSLNTASIALAVLVLAALCFVVSIIWSRIDRTAQELQQELPTANASTNTGRHQALDRLIENAMPIVEEQTLLPERMSYHGKEVGKRKLVIDQAHALTGPHYAVSAASAEETKSARTTVRSRSQSSSGAAVESRLDQAVQHVRKFRRDEPEKTEPAADASSHVPHTPPSRPASTPQTGLLDRVLLAMERERQR